jgi:glucose-1-phosphate cytidylyltransferase
MKTVLLAGGFGTRFAEETDILPKPMIEIGNRPILWHIMKCYAHHGFREFVVALGYKADVIKRYFLDHMRVESDFRVDLAAGKVTEYSARRDDFTVHLIDTGANSMTGGRLLRLAAHLRDGTFMMTYGDGVSSVNIRSLFEFHKRHGKLATLTAVRPPARFGRLEFKGDAVARFDEKPQIGEGWINGGFFVLEPKVFDYLTGDDCVWEREPLERLAADGQLMAYRCEDFWQCMDTLRDKRTLNQLWNDGRAPWAAWK